MIDGILGYNGLLQRAASYQTQQTLMPIANMDCRIGLLKPLEQVDHIWTLHL